MRFLSARIARGKVSPLSSLSVSNFDAIIFPGGFGAAKNLSDWATDGAKMKVLPEVEKVLKEFHEAKKPIGLCCISPVIGAKVFPGCQVTIGNDPETAKGISQMGSTNVSKTVEEVEIDTKNIIVTTPAYMYDAPPHQVRNGITKLVKNVLSLIKE